MFSIMGYIINDVYLTSSMIIFRNLGNLLYNIGLSADIARTIVKSIGYQIDYSSQNAPFLNAMYELQTIQNNILSDFKKWEFCAASNIVTDSLIPLWTFDENLPKIINKNMYNAIESFVFHIKSMIYALENNQTYINHAKFLIINGIGQTYDYFNHTILDLENCAVNRIETIGDIIYTLIFWGFAALGILLLIVFIFIYLTAKKIDEFWNFFIKSTQIQLMRLKTEAIERLGYAHNTEVNIEESINSSLNKKKHRVRTLIEINFTWRILVFFIISASYYFVIYFYLYPDCQSYMKNRPRLLNNFNIRRSLVSRVCMLSRDVYTPWFNKNFLLSYGFANSNFLVDLNAKILREKNKELREEKLMKMMSKELKQRIFESTNTTTPILKFGTDTAVEISIYDSTNIAYTSYIPAELILKYVAYLQIVQNNIGIEFELADNDSYNAINYQLNIIIATTAVYSIIFCALFFIYYLPFLHYQIKLLNLLSYLIEVLAID
ncbi:unnamed protein product [Blepharisma stoltei]|uniref:Envelope membrane protein n=1 Tax=Blepharisma stoltei TaxID=1481888 RepID=A0AAU9IZK0_9CILI|nr:unnamed protein product [Blepharisma stoltei]